jgi:hypothetical protein
VVRLLNYATIIPLTVFSPAALTFAEVQTQVRVLFTGRKVIGHSLHYDLAVQHALLSLLVTTNLMVLHRRLACNR